MTPNTPPIRECDATYTVYILLRILTYHIGIVNL